MENAEIKFKVGDWVYVKVAGIYQQYIGFINNIDDSDCSIEVLGVAERKHQEIKWSKLPFVCRPLIKDIGKMKTRLYKEDLSDLISLAIQTEDHAWLQELSERMRGYAEK